MAHTKGEWSIWDSETNPDYPHITISAKGTPKIAKVLYNFHSTNEMNANAKLIAAAPDLLEAIIGMAELDIIITSETKAILEKARKAINKATK